MGEKLNLVPVLNLHQLRERIFTLFEIRWIGFLALVTIAKLEEDTMIVTAKDVNKVLKLDPGWLYKHLRLLKEREFITVLDADLGVSRKMYVAYFGHRILAKIHDHIFSNQIKRDEQS